MKGIDRLELICDGELLNKHSDGGRHYGWNNPIDVLPPIGSVIEYKTFDQGYKEGQGVTSEYIVKGYRFTTEEGYNCTYRNKICKVYIDSLEEK